MDTRIYCCLIATALLASTSAYAKGKPSNPAKTGGVTGREGREREARKACLEGDYSKGVSILSDLFLDTKNPTYIFNQGRCYEQNERFGEAISRFREYLRMEGDDSGLAEKHISECEVLEAKRLAAIPAPVLSPAPLPPPQPAPAPSVAAPAAVFAPKPTVVVRQPDPSSSGTGLRTAGWIVGSVGLAGLAAGIVTNLKANSLAHSIDPPNTYSRGTESTRRHYETASWIGYGVGGAGIVTGAILLGIGWSKGGSAGGTLAVLPTVGAGTVGASAMGTF
jgi:hypothetical protein